MTDLAPLVSIGLLMYNGERYLRSSMDALLAQEYENFELIVSDNASTDTSGAIAQEYAAGDSRVKYRRNERNVGSLENCNRAFPLASGKYFMWASCHDTWDPKFLTACTQVMEQDDSVVLCMPRSMWIDQDGKEISPLAGIVDTRGQDPGKRFRRVLARHHPYLVYGLYRRDALQHVMPWRKTLGSDDLVLVELAFLGAFAFLDEQLFCMRKLGDFGDWHSYFRKLGLDLTPWTGPRYCWEYLRDHLAVVRRRAQGTTERLRLQLHTIGCVLFRSSPVFAAIILESCCPSLAGWLRRKIPHPAG